MLLRIFGLLCLCIGVSAHAQTFYVATNGVDTPAGGSLAAPWASITYALDRVPDQSLILVQIIDKGLVIFREAKS